MAHLPLTTVFAAMQAVPCIIALVQVKDATVRTVGALLLVVSAWLGLEPYLGFLRDITSGTLFQILAIVAAVLGVVVAVRLKQSVLGTLLISGGVLLALLALGVAGT